MTSFTFKSKFKSTEHDIEKKFKKLRKKKIFTPIVVFFIVAISLGSGYVAGTYHYQIEAAIGPVFGYKAHAGEIDLSSLQTTYSQLAAHYDGNLDLNKLIDGANHGLVDAVGDKYTIFMNASEATDFNNSLSGNIGGGIGAEIGLKQDKIYIIRPLKDNPAIKAGLQAGDFILKINDESTTGMSVDQAVLKIRGEVGTTVKLTIQSGSETTDYTITREVVNNPSVDSNVENGIGIMTISRFDDQTGDLARLAAQNFINQNVKSVILDLRGNGGGYVDAAVDVVGLWLNNKTVVTERSGNIVKDTLKSGNNAILANLPTVVLVNGGTASASEIVSGALQDYKAAKIVGETTYGKGSVQLPIALSGGSELKVTVAKWYTPNGKNINQEGITPDYKVGLTQTDIDNGTDPQLDKAKSVLGS